MPEDLTKEIYEYAISIVNQIKKENFKQQEILQAKRIKNLSDEQFLKLTTLGTCIIELLRHSLMYRIDGIYEAYWKDITYFIDKSSAKNSREEQVFRRALRWFLFNNTKKRPILIPDEIFVTDHPFIKNYDTPKGLHFRDEDTLIHNVRIFGGG